MDFPYDTTLIVVPSLLPLTCETSTRIWVLIKDSQQRIIPKCRGKWSPTTSGSKCTFACIRLTGRMTGQVSYTLPNSRTTITTTRVSIQPRSMRITGITQCTPTVLAPNKSKASRNAYSIFMRYMLVASWPSKKRRESINDMPTVDVRIWNSP